MKFKIALCQIGEEPDKEKSRKKAETAIGRAASEGAQLIALPEMWNCPYSSRNFPGYAEPADGATVTLMSRLAKELNIYLIGGSIPELDQGNVYNTSFCFDRRGELIGKHRKAHLYDVDIKGKIRFMESETLTAGDKVTVFETEFCKVGVAICYDVRFPEMIRKMALAGAKLIVLPAAFNMTTGPVHWDISMRARALDNQVYFAAVSPARVSGGVYQAYGSSCIATPWGEFLKKAGHEETIVYGEIDLEYLETIREQLPLLKHRREELY